MSSECMNDSKLIEKDGPYYTGKITRNAFYQTYLGLTTDEMIAVAHHPDDMVVSCMVNGIPMLTPYCNDLIQGTIKMFAPTYGVCYGFNFKDWKENTPSLITNYAGRDFGLELIINIESTMQAESHFCIFWCHI